MEVHFDSPTHDGGERIKGYTAIACHHGEKLFYVSGTRSPIRVLGLENGQAYTFVMYAVNAVGDGPMTADSEPCTPLAELGEEAGKIADPPPEEDGEGTEGETDGQGVGEGREDKEGADGEEPAQASEQPAE